jgi:hypothetical protein
LEITIYLELRDVLKKSTRSILSNEKVSATKTRARMVQAIGSLVIAAVIIGFTVELVLDRQKFNGSDQNSFDDLLVRYDYQLGACNVVAFLFLLVTTIMALRQMR